MRIQARVAPQVHHDVLPEGTARGNPTRGAAPRTPRLARAGFSDQSAFISKRPDVTSTFKREFGALASDPRKFHETMKTVYGAGYDSAKAEQYRQQALKGDFSWLPPVRTVSAQTLKGANGAYDAETGTVLINASLDPALAASTYVEEAGHHLDTQLNTEDTQGDEGELFRRVLSGEKLSPKQVADIRAENDKGLIRVDGREKEVEFWDPFGDIVDAVGDAVEAVGDVASSAVDAIGSAAKDVGSAVGAAAKAVGNALGSGAKWVGGALGTAAKAVGSAVGSAAKWVGGAAVTAAKWVGGAAKTFWERWTDGARSIFTGGLSTLVGAIRNWKEGIGTFFGGIGKLFQGKPGEGLKDMGLGLVKTFVQTPADAVLLMGGRALSAIQTMVGLEPPGRKLSEKEIETLRKVYGDSIDYSRIRIKEGDAGLFGASGRAFTHGDTLYIPKKYLPLQADLLVHETAHVWQHQNGGTDYMSEALLAQSVGDGYDFKKGLDEGKSWRELNPEQQAEFLEQAYLAGCITTPGKAFVYKGTDYTAQLNAALAEVRAGRGAG